MRAVLQRVTKAKVTVADEPVAAIGPGVLALVGVAVADGARDAELVARKIAELRILADEKSVADLGAEVLVVSQFTLYADTRKGRRPSWSKAAPGPEAEPLIQQVVQLLRDRGIATQTGRFGADMQVELTNDGPVTIIVES